VPRQPVDDRLGRVLALERAEQPVPDDEDAAVVPVEVALVAAMVDPVVRGGVEHLLTGAEAVDQLGVDPVLVQQVDAPGLLHEGRPDTEPGQQAKTGRASCRESVYNTATIA